MIAKALGRNTAFCSTIEMRSRLSLRARGFRPPSITRNRCTCKRPIDLMARDRDLYRSPRCCRAASFTYQCMDISPKAMLTGLRQRSFASWRAGEKAAGETIKLQRRRKDCILSVSFFDGAGCSIEHCAACILR